jgi:hypothetical protein
MTLDEYMKADYLTRDAELGIDEARRLLEVAIWRIAEMIAGAENIVSNVYKSITIHCENRSIEFRGNGVLWITDYEHGTKEPITMGLNQMKELGKFLVVAGNGLCDGVGNHGGDK